MKRYWDNHGRRYRQAVIISLDCISRGTTPLVVYHRNNRVARQVHPYLQNHLAGTWMVSIGGNPLSDNFNFRQYAAVDISLADPVLLPGGSHIAKGHTLWDNDFTPQNVLAVVNALTDFMENNPLKEKA